MILRRKIIKKYKTTKIYKRGQWMFVGKRGGSGGQDLI